MFCSSRRCCGRRCCNVTNDGKVAAVAVAAVATSSASLSRVHDFKDFSPRDFPHDFQLVRCTLILALCNRTVGDHFSNVVIRVKIIVTETVGGILTEVHTHIADRRVYVLFKRAGASILFTFARPIGVEHLIAFNHRFRPLSFVFDMLKPCGFFLVVTDL